MWFEGPSSGESRRLSLAIFFVVTCCVTSFGKKTTGHGAVSRSSPLLAITSIGPNSGPTAGGTTVAIAGTGFTQSASVLFGGVPAPAVAYVSSSELLATSPARTSGTVSIAVTENPHNQSATLTGAYTYTAPNTSASTSNSSSGAKSLDISGVFPSQGPTSGGTIVAITGTGFQVGTTVKFGSVQSTAVTITSSTQMNAVSPPENPGTIGITVTGSDSQSASLPSAFTYTPGPSITSISPNSGPITGGTIATILGSGFQSGASVAFGSSLSASVTVVSSTEIQAVAPASPAGTVSIAVANSDSQTGTLASAFTFYHTVSLAWTNNTPSIAGYNVYRGSNSGGPYAKLNSSLVSGTSFSDNAVQPGQTYFYVTTAVDSNNVESAYSNQAKATVPSP